MAAHDYPPSYPGVYPPVYPGVIPTLRPRPPTTVTADPRRIALDTVDFASAAVAEKPTSPVEGTLQRIRKEQGATLELLGRLEEVLASALAPAGTAPNAAPDPNLVRNLGDGFSPLHERLLGIASAECDIGERLQALIERITL